MKFLTTLVEQKKRKTNINNYPLKSEEITLKIKLISSGNTSNFSSVDICDIVLDKLREIKPN